MQPINCCPPNYLVGFQLGPFWQLVLPSLPKGSFRFLTSELITKHSNKTRRNIMELVFAFFFFLTLGAILDG